MGGAPVGRPCEVKCAREPDNRLQDYKAANGVNGRKVAALKLYVRRVGVGRFLCRDIRMSAGAI
ncbi:hypothetical protein CS8_094080 [Cupriavidus sp. 8B]